MVWVWRGGYRYIWDPIWTNGEPVLSNSADAVAVSFNIYRGSQRVQTKSEGEIAMNSIDRLAQYIGHYKLAITVLCFVPYIALKLMS